ncbi:hypothetical protein DF196_12720 [Bifidobacterium callitrichidarum]|uniref:Uncharacterized protein n=1 Tax=Bifidobacterium callitrichidarum TaxID=2052941 RepID=A0A2U2MZD5_9BIFI|nr:hypothetical protein DF196_12720 [Bifidobacterium callitrichidarum]
MPILNQMRAEKMIIVVSVKNLHSPIISNIGIIRQRYCHFIIIPVSIGIKKILWRMRILRKTLASKFATILV